MDNCYALLGIGPTADTEEIEEAYKKKKKELLANAADAAKLQELDDAYNEAIIATFAPIRAFASPLPPLTTVKKGLPPLAAPPPPVGPEVLRSNVAPPPPPPPQPPKTELQPSIPASMPSEDDRLINMDVSELRESYLSNMDEQDEAENSFFTLGIENKLMRYYAWTFIVMVAFDMLMRLWIGQGWLTLTEIPDPLKTPPPLPKLKLVLFSFVSMAYCFVCALPMPFATRFFVMGQSPDKKFILMSLFFLGVVCAFLLRRLTGFLPDGVTGSSISFALAAMILTIGTLRYEER